VSVTKRGIRGECGLEGPGREAGATGQHGVRSRRESGRPIAGRQTKAGVAHGRSLAWGIGRCRASLVDALRAALIAPARWRPGRFGP
jgi:hypothetical protein